MLNPGTPKPDTGPAGNPDYRALARAIKRWGRMLGFQQVGITDTELAADEARLLDWLAAGRHGEMDYMARHGTRRARPAELVPGTIRVISVRMDYLPPAGAAPHRVLEDGTLGYVSRYALGRDYHKVLRKRLQKLADLIQAEAGPFGYRVFVDSAPVLEKPLARKAGLGWVGKHTNLIHPKAGSWFFLGELYTNLPLPVDEPGEAHCGTCTACIDVCPTRAITAPYRLDARRCISYLTIEHKGPIPAALRPLMGNRIYGCDDCQLACPWNRFARPTPETDFLPRHGLDAPRLTELFAWNEEGFLKRTEGSPIRRIGHERWLRNIAIALGNAPATPGVVAALKARADHPSELVREHVAWALARAAAATSGSPYRGSWSVLHTQVVVDEPVRGAVVAGDLPVAFQLRQDGLGQLLARLHAPLVEGVDVPDHALHEDLLFVQDDKHAQGARR